MNLNKTFSSTAISLCYLFEALTSNYSGRQAYFIIFTLRLCSHGTGRIFYRWKIRAFGRFVDMEPRQTYEILDAQAFKNLNTKIEGEFLAGAVNNLTAMV